MTVVVVLAALPRDQHAQINAVTLWNVARAFDYSVYCHRDSSLDFLLLI